MRTQRTYSLFVMDEGKWVRVTPLALVLKDARRTFQGALLGGTMAGKAMELRPAAEDFANAEVYKANGARLFPKAKKHHSGIDGIWVVRKEDRPQQYWNTTAASWIDGIYHRDDVSKFVKKSAADEVARERGGIVVDTSWLLLGHNMHIGKNLMYYRDTVKGIGGALELSKATYFTEAGATVNAIPDYGLGRTRPEGMRYGWEIVHISEAHELAEVEEGGVKKIVKLDN